MLDYPGRAQKMVFSDCEEFEVELNPTIPTVRNMNQLRFTGVLVLIIGCIIKRVVENDS